MIPLAPPGLREASGVGVHGTGGPVWVAGRVEGEPCPMLAYSRGPAAAHGTPCTMNNTFGITLGVQTPEVPLSGKT